MEVFRTEDLVIAELRHMDAENRGVEIPEKPRYAFLKKFGDIYINALDEDADLPVLERTLYTNTTSCGESYGNQLRLVHGDITDGECYVILMPFSDVTEKEKFWFNELSVLLGKIQGVKDLDQSKINKKLRKPRWKSLFKNTRS